MSKYAAKFTWNPNRKVVPVMTYKQCEEDLEENDKIQLCNNTILLRDAWSIGYIITLHNATILRVYEDCMYATLAGYNTNTTRTRLSNITPFNWSTIKGQAYIDKYPIDDNQEVKLLFDKGVWRIDL